MSFLTGLVKWLQQLFKGAPAAPAAQPSLPPSQAAAPAPQPALAPTMAYQDFRNAMGARESSNRYFTINTLGYLGRYQFGTPRLTDLGLCARKPGTTGFSNADFGWVAPFSQGTFLASSALQDACFDASVWRYQAQIKQDFEQYLNTRVNGTLLTLSGAVACCHLLGPGGLDAFCKGTVLADANGVTATDYITQFAGYGPLGITPSASFTFFKSLLT